MSDNTAVLEIENLDTNGNLASPREIELEIELDYSLGETSIPNEELDQPDSSNNNNNNNQFNFITINKWKGEVTVIEDDEFEAIITDLTEGGTKEEITFSFEDVSEDDRELIQEGAIFYWKIGYHVIRGMRMKGSIIKFRRMPKLSKRKIDQMFDHANKMAEKLKFD